MIRDIGRLLACAALASGLVACARTSPPPPEPASGPLTVETYTARLLQAQTELVDLGRHTVPLPHPSAEFQVACQCVVIQKPNVVGPPPAPVEDVQALERGIAVLQVALNAARAGKQVEVVATPSDH